jgi:hypothetical protein
MVRPRVSAAQGEGLAASDERWEELSSREDAARGHLESPLMLKGLAGALRCARFTSLH